MTILGNLFDSSSLSFPLCEPVCSFLLPLWSPSMSRCDSLHPTASRHIRTDRGTCIHNNKKDTHYSHFPKEKEKRRGRAGVRGVEGGAFKNIQHRSKTSPVLGVLSSRCPTQPQEEAEGGSAPRAEGSTGQQETRRDTPCLKGICFILNWCLGPRLRFASAAMTAMEMRFL